MNSKWNSSNVRPGQLDENRLLAWWKALQIHLLPRHHHRYLDKLRSERHERDEHQNRAPPRHPEKYLKNPLR